MQPELDRNEVSYKYTPPPPPPPKKKTFYHTMIPALTSNPTRCVMAAVTGAAPNDCCGHGSGEYGSSAGDAGFGESTSYL